MFDYSDREDLQGLYYAFDELMPGIMGETGADYLDGLLDAADDQQDAVNMIASHICDLWDLDSHFIEVCERDEYVLYNVCIALETAGAPLDGAAKQLQTEITRRRIAAA